MYKETVASHKKTLFIIIGFIVLAMMLFAIVDAIPANYRPFLQLGLLLVLTALVYCLMRLHVADYSYLIIDDELVFNKKVSHSDLSLLTLKIANIINIVPLSIYKESTPIPHNKTYSIKKTFGKKGIYVCTFTQNNERCKVLFEPTEKLLTILAKKREDLRAQRVTAFSDTDNEQ